MLKLIIYKLKRVFHFFKTGLLEGLPAQIFYKFPNQHLTIVAITGTDGKTTTSTLTYNVLKAAGKKVALISTVAAFKGEDKVDTGFHVTSPQPKLVYQFMRQMVDEGYTHLVLETTSHGAYQYRNWGIHPQIAGLTNIDREHLDYHINYDEYVKAKLLILDAAEKSFVNADDESYKKIKDLDRLTDSMNPYSAEDELPAKVRRTIKDKFPEDYNQMNARLAYLIGHELGVSDDDACAGLKNFSGVPGRMQVVTEKPFRVIVDFAHTPQALEAVLKAIRSEHPHGRLIAVFGCAGLRDTSKRPAMGRIGSELADLAIFTAEDPRTEDIWSIIRQMKEGIVDTHAKVISIADRKEAVTAALLKYAKPGDTVGIFGKGHEESMCYGTIEYPWNDAQAVREILQLEK
jgi:UDP-N-acetylmuramoyl-L-alanyl-D-glutamate--2,6-diaminopimelate ligase